MNMSCSDFIYSALGVVGCALVAFAQVPNILRVYKRKQSLDISYTYQFVLAGGVLLFVFYYTYYQSVLVYPAAISLIFILYLSALKFYIEVLHNPRTAAGEGFSNGVTLEHALLPEDEERSDDRGHESVGNNNTAPVC